ncbi:MAG: adenine phosphoribosyltransferase [Candidatus Diapherotrites archaeon]|nr:adenine phosphoribosyltransferase [Candidatus Diapherotrites archaeon]
MKSEELKRLIREIPDFPKKGILFYDITTLLGNGRALRTAADLLFGHYDSEGKSFDKVASMESRGFIFGAMLAYKFGAGFVPIRKPGKLPAKAFSQEFEKEYGFDSFEVHSDAIEKGEKVLICDDLLATGGTAAAAVRLVERMDGKVNGLAFLIELSFLNGREKLGGYDVFSLLKYEK